MLHCYQLGGLNIVLDIYSGSVHLVDEVAYDIISMYEQKPREEILSEILKKYGDREDVTESEIEACFEDIEALKAAGKKNAFFFGWHELRDLVRPSNLSYSCFMRGIEFGYVSVDRYISDEAIRVLNATDIDFTFLYLGHPDFAGHRSGWMKEEYMESIQTSWDNIDRVVSALPEDYTVIITADHGGHGRMHGTDMPEDMTTPIIVIGAGVDRFGTLENANIKDIAPTIAALLGVPADPDWEGKSLLAE